MAMVVKNNMSAVRTLNTLNANTSALQKSLQKVSSGMKINSAQDDASGYAISERMRVRIRSLDQANQNTQNDASLMKTAEGAVGNTVEILRALKEKAINAANDSNTDEDRQTIQKEINQFIDQIDDNALVQFNGKYLIDGSKNNATVSSKTILLNQSLKAGTLEGDDLTTLRNRAGDSLGIQTSDKWQVSYVQNGNITFVSGTVGDKSIEDILNAAWDTGKTDKDGNAITFGQVAATTEDGRISKAKPAIVEIGQLGDGTEDTDVGMDSAVLAKIKEAITAAGGDLRSTAGSSYTLDELGFYAKEDGTAFGSDVTVTVDAATDGDGDGVGDADGNVTVKGAPSGAKIYADEVETEIPPTKESSAKATDASATSENIYADGTLAKELVDAEGTGKLAITVPGTATTVTATMKLSELLAKDSAGNDIANTPKYYLQTTAGDMVAADDITVTRSKTFYADAGDNNAIKYQPNTDKIAFTFATGTASKYGNPAPSAPSDLPTLYEYKESTSGTGFDDAWDKFGKAVYTPDKTEGIAVAASGEGVNDQISGLTISILDQDGNVKKAANAALDQFKQYQRAENQTGDMSLNFHIGSEANVAIKVGMSDMRSEALGLKGSDGTRLDVYTKEHANSAINVIENALTKALDQQTTIGAIEARLEYTSTNLTTSSENVQAAESTIRDADMAKEMTNYTKSNVLLQAAQAMLAQANQNSSAVLSLLQ